MFREQVESISAPEALSQKDISVVVLAGGKGTRLSTETGGYIPKALVPLSPNVTLIDQVVKGLRQIEFNKFVFCLGLHSDQVYEHLEEESKKGEEVKFSYSIEDKPLGTAGAAKLAIETNNINSPFLVINCDGIYPYHRIPSLVKNFKTGSFTWGITSVTRVDMEEYHNQILEKGSNAIVGKKDFGWHNDNRTEELNKKDKDLLVFQDGGLGILDPKTFLREYALFERIARLKNLDPKTVCLFSDIFPMLAEQNRRKVIRGLPPLLFGVDLEGLIYDMGRVGRLEQARKWYEEFEESGFFTTPVVRMDTSYDNFLSKTRTASNVSIQ